MTVVRRMVGINGVRELRVEICRPDLKLVRISTPVGMRVSTPVEKSRRTLSTGQKRSFVHGRSLTVSQRNVVGTCGRSPALFLRRHSCSKSDVA